MMKDSIGQQLVSSSKTKLEYLNTGAIPTIKDHSHMRTIFKRLLLFIWKSSISCQLGAAIPWVEGEIIFKDDQRVHYFPIHIAYSRNEIRGIPHETFQLMSMDMPYYTNARLNL